MAWAWVRPADPSVLSGRPLLDLGAADGQTVAALVEPRGLVVGVDRSVDALRSAGCPTLAADALHLPFLDGSFGAVLAADLFHHVSDDELVCLLGEIARVVQPRGALVAWWWAEPGRSAPDAPRFPRAFIDVAEVTRAAGFRAVEELDLEVRLPHGPPTTGIISRR